MDCVPVLAVALLLCLVNNHATVNRGVLLKLWAEYQSYSLVDSTVIERTSPMWNVMIYIRPELTTLLL